jgi:hypothetical protein
MLEIHAEMRVGFGLKMLLNLFEPNGRGSTIICISSIKFHENPSNGS